MVSTTPPVTKNFTHNGIDYTATFNGKIYGKGKRYINVSYRINDTGRGLRNTTCIWQDGFGWVEDFSAPINKIIIGLFNLK